jgi:hypothetical protein
MRLCGDVQKEIDQQITGNQIANGGTIAQKLSSSLLKLEEPTVARSSRECMRHATRLMGAGLPVLVAIAVGFAIIGLELVATGQDVRQKRQSAFGRPPIRRVHALPTLATRTSSLVAYAPCRRRIRGPGTKPFRDLEKVVGGVFSGERNGRNSVSPSSVRFRAAS